MQWLKAIEKGNTEEIATARAALLQAAEQCRARAAGSSQGSGGQSAVNTANMRLDVFLAQHTSEDNAAFEDILAEEHAAAQDKNWWLYRRHDTGPQVAALSDNAEAVRALLRDRAAGRAGDGTGGNERHAHGQHEGLSGGRGVNHWAYRPRNQLFFTPDLAVSNHISKVKQGSAHRRDAVKPAPPLLKDGKGGGRAEGGGSTALAPPSTQGTQLVAASANSNVSADGTLPQAGSALVALPRSDTDMAVLAPKVRLNAAGGRVQPRRIVHAATRLGGQADLNDVFFEKHQDDEMQTGPQERMQQMLRDRAVVGGYTYVSTPSPMPGAGGGVDATPGMTWGTVAATPQLAVSNDAGTVDTPLIPRGGGARGSTNEERLVSLDSGLLELMLQRAEAAAGVARARREASGGGGEPALDGGNATPFVVAGASNREALARRMARRGGSTLTGGGASSAKGTPSAAAMTAARSLLRDVPAGTPVFAATGPASMQRAAQGAITPGGVRGGVKRPRSSGQSSAAPARPTPSAAALALARQMGVRPPTGLQAGKAGQSKSARRNSTPRRGGGRGAPGAAKAALSAEAAEGHSTTSGLL